MLQKGGLRQQLERSGELGKCYICRIVSYKKHQNFTHTYLSNRKKYSVSLNIAAVLCIKIFNRLIEEVYLSETLIKRSYF